MLMCEVNGEGRYEDWVSRPTAEDLNISAVAVSSSSDVPKPSLKNDTPFNLSKEAFLVTGNAQFALENTLNLFLNKSMKVWRDNDSNWHSNSPIGALTSTMANQDPRPAMEDLAFSLSQQLRTAAENSEYNMTGSVIQNKTIVDISWGWITFPTLLLLTSVGFLIITINKSKGQMLWKSSNIALVLYSSNVEHSEITRARNSKTSDIERIANGSTLTIHETDGAWQLTVRQSN